MFYIKAPAKRQLETLVKEGERNKILIKLHLFLLPSLLFRIVMLLLLLNSTFSWTHWQYNDNLSANIGNRFVFISPPRNELCCGCGSNVEVSPRTWPVWSVVLVVVLLPCQAAGFSLSLFLCLVTNRCHGSHTHSLPIMAKFPFVSCKQTNLNLMHNPTFRVCTTHTYPSTMTTTMPHSHYPIANKVWKTGEIYRFNRITFELLIPQECLIGMRRTNQPPLPSGLGPEQQSMRN